MNRIKELSKVKILIKILIIMMKIDKHELSKIRI
jgi:hypothetical protein